MLYGLISMFIYTQNVSTSREGLIAGDPVCSNENKKEPQAIFFCVEFFGIENFLVFYSISCLLFIFYMQGI